MIVNLNIEYPPNFILELLKTIGPGLIGLVPFFYNVLTEERRKESEKKEITLRQLYNFTQDYYISSLNYSLSVNKDSQEKEKIKDAIYNNRMNFRKVLLKSRKYLKRNEYKVINELKELLLNLDQNILYKLDDKNEKFKNVYDILSQTYETTIEMLNEYI